MAASMNGHSNGAPKRPTTWDEDEIKQGKANYPESMDVYEITTSPFNPTPGTGKTGLSPVPPNNYPFYNDDEMYRPNMQADGGQVSEWKPMYNPTPEQEEEDRQKAFDSGVPHGFVPPGNKYADMPTIRVMVRSDLHEDEEYGVHEREDGTFYGGPFFMDVPVKMRIEDLRIAIRDKCGIPPALLRLSYAGKTMLDSQRTMEHYGVTYWHKKFPHWPIVILRH